MENYVDYTGSGSIISMITLKRKKVGTGISMKISWRWIRIVVWKMLDLQGIKNCNYPYQAQGTSILKSYSIARNMVRHLVCLFFHSKSGCFELRRLFRLMFGNLGDNEECWENFMWILSWASIYCPLRVVPVCSPATSVRASETPLPWLYLVECKGSHLKCIVLCNGADLLCLTTTDTWKLGSQYPRPILSCH